MDKTWLTAAQLAGLPGMPVAARTVNAWGGKGLLDRRKRGKGKGWEYNLNSLPAETQAALRHEWLPRHNPVAHALDLIQGLLDGLRENLRHAGLEDRSAAVERLLSTLNEFSEDFAGVAIVGEYTWLAELAASSANFGHGARWLSERDFPMDLQKAMPRLLRIAALSPQDPLHSLLSLSAGLAQSAARAPGATGQGRAGNAGCQPEQDASARSSSGARPERRRYFPRTAPPHCGSHETSSTSHQTASHPTPGEAGQSHQATGTPVAPQSSEQRSEFLSRGSSLDMKHDLPLAAQDQTDGAQA